MYSILNQVIKDSDKIIISQSRTSTITFYSINSINSKRIKTIFLFNILFNHSYNSSNNISKLNLITLMFIQIITNKFLFKTMSYKCQNNWTIK